MPSWVYVCTGEVSWHAAVTESPGPGGGLVGGEVLEVEREVVRGILIGTEVGEGEVVNAEGIAGAANQSFEAVVGVVGDRPIVESSKLETMLFDICSSTTFVRVVNDVHVAGSTRCSYVYFTIGA